MELKVQAMNLWAGGLSFQDIATKLGIKSYRTIQNWKTDKYPDDWDRYKTEMVQQSVIRVREETLDSIAQVKVRQQRRLGKLQEASLYALGKRAEAGTLSDEVALDAFTRAIEEEQKLYLTVEEVHAQRQHQSAIGAHIDGPSGTVDLFAYMNSEYEKSRKLPEGSGEGGPK